ncbi:hypothetical protein MNBD_GAMMA06-613 [hydrothermal vent metagenome]|uniref:ASPIC/UnbV domain-containing protein n=1 Tax=hydrothermal vent metagenome TaxID=652676 RepID=A0A3B0WQT1_9ZZZZ
MRIRKRIFTVLLLALIAFFAVINADRFVRPVFENKYFNSHFLGTHYFLNDLAGVSPKQPALAEVYLLSHSARAAVVVPNERQQLELVAADKYGLSQDPKIKGWGSSSVPVNGKGELQLYYYRTFLVGEFQPDDTTVRQRNLKITIPWHSIHAAFGGIDISSEESASATIFDIKLNSAGRFWIETQPPPSDGFAIEFNLQGFAPGEVRIGAEQLPIDKNQFTLTTRDLHSLALTELDGDVGAEISVVRGGVRGRIGEVDPAASDLLVVANTSQSLVSDSPEFLKRGCPGRQSAWVDIDFDGDLDLYVSCGRPHEPAAQFGNQLFENTANGLVENGEKFAVNFQAYGAFRFIDWDGDLDPDLWWADASGELQYYENQKAQFVLRSVFAGTWKGSYRPPQLMIQDFTKDRFPDLVVFHPAGNLLIENRNGESKMILLPMLGLPQKTVAGHWLDIDLDGNIDLLTALNGVYLNQGNAQFKQEKSNLKDKLFIRDARLVSFATDEGRRLLIAYRTCLPSKFCGARRVALSLLRGFLPLELDSLEFFGLIEPYDWPVYVLERSIVNSAFKEVAITLQGSRFNPLAIGGRVDLSWASQKQSHWVAETDSALYSRADFTMYASLPISEEVNGHAYWPDGCKVDFVITEKNHQLQISRPLSCR